MIYIFIKKLKDQPTKQEILNYICISKTINVKFSYNFFQFVNLVEYNRCQNLKIYLFLLFISELFSKIIETLFQKYLNNNYLLFKYFKYIFS
jgi:hypothetical protein